MCFKCEQVKEGSYRVVIITTNVVIRKTNRQMMVSEISATRNNSGTNLSVLGLYYQHQICKY